MPAQGYSSISDYVLSEEALKLSLLLGHYGIHIKDPDRWAKLAYSLAKEHVPGLRVVEQPSPGKGARRKWNFAEATRFVDIIDKIERARRKGVPDAIRAAIKRKQLAGNPETLKTRYYELKRIIRRRSKAKDLEK